jgi:hypothetical protein
MSYALLNTGGWNVWTIRRIFVVREPVAYRWRYYSHLTRCGQSRLPCAVII